MTENEGQVDRAAMELQRRASILESELECLITPGMYGDKFRRALDAYVDFRVGWMLSQTILNGAQLIRVGECPSP